MMNVPLLSTKKTFFKSKDPVKTILLEDIHRCVNKQEAELLMTDTYAEDEMIRLLEERYGPIEESFFINNDIDRLIGRMLGLNKNIVRDEIDDFEKKKKKTAQVSLDDESFESLMTVTDSERVKKINRFREKDA